LKTTIVGKFLNCLNIQIEVFKKEKAVSVHVIETYGGTEV